MPDVKPYKDTISGKNGKARRAGKYRPKVQGSCLLNALIVMRKVHIPPFRAKLDPQF